MTKFFKLFGKNVIFHPKMVAPPKQIISHNLYIGINVLVYGKCLVVSIGSMTKKKVCVKKMSQMEYFFGVNPSPKYVQAYI